MIWDDDVLQVGRKRRTKACVHPIVLRTRSVRKYCPSLRPTFVHERQVYALLLVEEEDRRSKEVALGGRAEQLELLCRKNAYLQDKVCSSWCGVGVGGSLLICYFCIFWEIEYRLTRQHKNPPVGRSSRLVFSIKKKLKTLSEAGRNIFLLKILECIGGFVYDGS